MNNKIISHYPPGYKSPTELLHKNQQLNVQLQSGTAKSKLPLEAAIDVTAINQNRSNGKGMIAICLLIIAIIGGLTILANSTNAKEEYHE